jgi:hypothetical protein
MTATAKPRKLFVNLAVNDLPRTKAFFSKLGFTYDPQFTNDEAACMPLSEEAFVMLLRRDRFKDFTKKDICDTRALHRRPVRDLVRQPRGGRRDGERRDRRRRHGGHRSAGSGLHVRADLL